MLLTVTLCIIFVYITMIFWSVCTKIVEFNFRLKSTQHSKIWKNSTQPDPTQSNPTRGLTQPIDKSAVTDQHQTWQN